MRLFKNVGYNLMGLVAPILLALICIPPLISRLGTPAFGLLTLVWVILGYFSIFDIGIGRALTLSLAARRAKQQISSIGSLVTTAVSLAALLGLLGASLLAVVGQHLADLITRPDGMLESTAWTSLMLVALSLPFVTATAALRGALEAYERFDLTSAIRLAMGFITYGGPLLVLQFYDGLVAVVAFLAAARVITWAVHLAAVRRVLPEVADSPRRLVRDEIAPLLVSGGWMTVSNIISPLMTYLDRFVVAYIVGAATVAYYTTPYEAITRLTIVPEAVLGVLFPALGAALATDPERAKRLFGQSMRVMLAVMLPVAVVLVVLAGPLLSAWLGAEFSHRSRAVLQVLTLGIAVNCLARVTFTIIQGAGRSDMTAKLHLVELPIFLLVLIGLTHAFGIVGAAVAWALRATVDFLLLMWLQNRLVPLTYGIRALPVCAAMLLAGAAMGVGASHQAGWFSGAAAATFAAALLCSGWLVLHREDRRLLASLAARLRRKR